MTQAIVSIVTKLRDVRLIRYVLASVGALAVDVGSFLAFMAMGVAAAPASAMGYSLGILAHWLMSSRAVFQDSVAERGMERTKQKALFVISALVGLGLTTAIVQIGEWTYLHPLVSKGVAVVVAFTATWLLRSKIVFRAEGT
ncbi:MAG: GtrA family protein [Pseudomonadota bacterium]